MAYQQRGQRLAHREAVGKVETEFEPWRATPKEDSSSTTLCCPEEFVEV